MRTVIDRDPAGPTDPLRAVGVERDGFAALGDESVIQTVEQFQPLAGRGRCIAAGPRGTTCPPSALSIEAVVMRVTTVLPPTAQRRYLL